MEYEFCALDWDCWYGWIWSASTAAWLQAVGTLFAVWISLRLWWKEQRYKLDDEALEHQRNLAIAKCAFGLCDVTLGEARESIEPQKLDLAVRILEKAESELFASVRAGLPNDGAMAYIYGRVGRITEITMFMTAASHDIRDAVESESAPVQRTLRIRIEDAVAQFQDEMKSSYKRVVEYQGRHLTNPLATWNDPLNGES